MCVLQGMGKAHFALILLKMTVLLAICVQITKALERTLVTKYFPKKSMKQSPIESSARAAMRAPVHALRLILFR